MSHVFAFALFATLSASPREPVQVEEQIVVSDGDSRPVIRFTQGKYGRRIEEETFYRAVGRPDLADEYTRRRSKRRVLGIAAAGIGLGGLLAAGTLVASSCSSSNQRFSAECAPGTPLLVVGLSSLAALGFVVAASAIDPHPVALHEMREMADQHNRSLDLRASAFLAPGGGGLLVRGKL